MAVNSSIWCCQPNVLRFRFWSYSCHHTYCSFILLILQSVFWLNFSYCGSPLIKASRVVFNRWAVRNIALSLSRISYGVLSLSSNRQIFSANLLFTSVMHRLCYRINGDTSQSNHVYSGAESAQICMTSCVYTFFEFMVYWIQEIFQALGCLKYLIRRNP